MFCTKNPQISSATVQNSVTRVIWYLQFVHTCFHIFSTLVQNRCEWSASCTGHFTMEKQSIVLIGREDWWILVPDWDPVKKRKKLITCWESIPVFLVIQTMVEGFDNGAFCLMNALRAFSLYSLLPAKQAWIQYRDVRIHKIDLGSLTLTCWWWTCLLQ
jgi:hypothetical protein